jgi:hypothetical protein
MNEFNFKTNRIEVIYCCPNREAMLEGQDIITPANAPGWKYVHRNSGTNVRMFPSGAAVMVCQNI